MYRRRACCSREPLHLIYSTEKKDATCDEMTEAAETAQAMEFIKTKEHGLDEEVAQGGTNVSGGQKQRLSIARALVKKANVYLFDDSFSALDFKTDQALRKALKERWATALSLSSHSGSIQSWMQIRSLL